MIDHKGKLYARVSDIIKPFVNFGRVSEEVLERTAARGSRVHQAIHDEVEGNFPILVGYEKGYLQSFQKWRETLQPEFVESEVRYYCDHKMITGCIDALVKLHGEDKAILVDYKTSAQESPITWPMQAHLYYYLITSSGKEIAPRFLFLKLDRFAGLPKVFQYDLDKNIMAKCMEAIDAFWNKNVATNP